MIERKGFNFEISKPGELAIVPGVSLVCIYKAAISDGPLDDHVGYFLDKDAASKSVKGRGPWGGDGWVMELKALRVDENNSYWRPNLARFGLEGIEIYESYDDFIKRHPRYADG